jgi:hypothetical protein
MLAHQFHAVNMAVEETIRASGMGAGTRLRDDLGESWAGRMHGGKPGDRRAGVVWHTQGSGKSFSMLFYAARVVRHPAMQNPTLQVLTKTKKPKMIVEETDRTERDEREFIETVVGVLRAVDARVFFPIRNSMCGGCAFQRRCGNS